jgi:hypothetical protein
MQMDVNIAEPGPAALMASYQEKLSCEVEIMDSNNISRRHAAKHVPEACPTDS